MNHVGGPELLSAVLVDVQVSRHALDQLDRHSRRVERRELSHDALVVPVLADVRVAVQVQVRDHRPNQIRGHEPRRRRGQQVQEPAREPLAVAIRQPAVRDQRERCGGVRQEPNAREHVGNPHRIVRADGVVRDRAVLRPDLGGTFERALFGLALFVQVDGVASAGKQAHLQAYYAEGRRTMPVRDVPSLLLAHRARPGAIPAPYRSGGRRTRTRDRRPPAARQREDNAARRAGASPCRGVDPGGGLLAAASREQARILYEQAARFARELNHPNIIDRHLELRWCPDRSRARVFERHLRVLAADAPRLHGLTPSLAIVDELHAHPNADVYLALLTALAKRKGAKLIVISSAGQGADSPLGRLRARGLGQPSVRVKGAFTEASGAVSGCSNGRSRTGGS